MSNTSFNYYATNFKKKHRTIWRGTKRFKRSQIIILPIRKTDGTWARSNKKNTETYADYLTNVFQLLPLNVPDKAVEDYFKVLCPMTLPIKLISPAEI